MESVEPSLLSLSASLSRAAMRLATTEFECAVGTALFAALCTATAAGSGMLKYAMIGGSSLHNSRATSAKRKSRVLHRIGLGYGLKAIFRIIAIFRLNTHGNPKNIPKITQNWIALELKFSNST